MALLARLEGVMEMISARLDWDRLSFLTRPSPSSAQDFTILGYPIISYSITPRLHYDFVTYSSGLDLWFPPQKTLKDIICRMKDDAHCATTAASNSRDHAAVAVAAEYGAEHSLDSRRTPLRVPAHTHGYRLTEIIES